MRAPLTAALTLAAAALLIRGLRAEDKRPLPSDRVKAFLGGESVVSILWSADRVECFRVHPEKPPEPMGKECGGYPITATAEGRKADFARSIADILFDERTYLFDTAKRCAFEPGVGFRFWIREKEHVELLLCFHCDELEVHYLPPGAREPKTAREDFDPARPALVRIVKDGFPKDEEIQKLEEKRK
ncbi:MAG: hypothetical protein HUU15_00605 [Candidatus Brocadiae bacterium]|nr:hypothetical protein [Candidatus Brocadiia bacterium]